MSAPEAVVIAGPNGSGKSTLTSQLSEYAINLPDVYINPDDIARGLLEQEPDAFSEDRNRKAFEEGRRLRQEYREQGISFALETVFSHPSGLLDLQKLHEAGYGITLAVVTTSDPKINVRRVAGRVKKGGHAVDEEKIRERYGRFMGLLPRMVEMADRVLVFDTSEEIQLCYRRERFSMEFNVPTYLRHALMEPLVQREQSQLRLNGLLLPDEAIEIPDEEAGVYEGIIRACIPHYALQVSILGRCIRHDTCLITAPLEAGKHMRVVYRAGSGKVERLNSI